tara:strand:- start:6692 stop:7621 length:930 start_codon:yes stop_codon:yes gene_type:complete
MFKNIVFMGTSNFAVSILKSLYQNGYPISTVYTQPPQKSKRGQKLNKSPINLIAETLNLEVRVPNTLNKNYEEENYFKKIKPELCIVVAYGQIIPKNFLKIPKYGFINIHASLLPKWRGAAPIQRTIMNLDNETGISLMKLNENLDEGPVCSQHKIKITKNMNSTDLSESLASLASQKILTDLDSIYDGSINFVDQDHSKATYANKIKKSEGKINWNESANKIIGKINGLYPFPGAWFVFKGERYKILKSEFSNSKGTPGTILNENLEISCSENSIKVLEIQREGKKVQKASEFMLGTKLKKGTNLNDV